MEFPFGIEWFANERAAGWGGAFAPNGHATIRAKLAIESDLEKACPGLESRDGNRFSEKLVARMK
jgi:hypothetical protein